jgi:hypothetical protein
VAFIFHCLLQNCDRLGHWQTPGGNGLSGSSDRLGEHDMAAARQRDASAVTQLTGDLEGLEGVSWEARTVVDGPADNRDSSTGLRGPGPEAPGRPGIAVSTVRRRLMRLLPRGSLAAAPLGQAGSRASEMPSPR